MSTHRTREDGLIRRIMGRWGSAAGIVVTLVVLLAGIALITLVEIGDARPVLHWLHVHVLASASIAAVAAVAAVIVPLLQSSRQDRREAQRAISTSRAEKLKLVRAHCMIDPVTGWLPELRRLDAIAGPLRLGVHPAAEIDQSTLGGQVPASNMPAYIERDIDGEMDAALAAGGLVLLEGNSTAGKSRAAYEALRRLPADTWLLVPGRESLRALLNEDVLDEATLRAAGFEPKDIVVWLNDLEYYLGPRGLDVHLLQALTNASSRRLDDLFQGVLVRRVGRYL